MYRQHDASRDPEVIGASTHEQTCMEREFGLCNEAETNLLAHRRFLRLPLALLSLGEDREAVLLGTREREAYVHSYP